jgi:hypothetical protein
VLRFEFPDTADADLVDPYRILVVQLLAPSFDDDNGSGFETSAENRSGANYLSENRCSCHHNGYFLSCNGAVLTRKDPFLPRNLIICFRNSAFRRRNRISLRCNGSSLPRNRVLRCRNRSSRSCNRNDWLCNSLINSHLHDKL